LTGKTLLIGSGVCARRIAEDIIAQESDMIVASTGEDFGVSSASVTADKAEELATVCTNTKVISCQGTVGDFRVALDCNGEKQIAAVNQVIIAEDEKRIPKFSLYGLSQTNRVMAISRVKKDVLQTYGPRIGRNDIGLVSDNTHPVFIGTDGNRGQIALSVHIVQQLAQNVELIRV